MGGDRPAHATASVVRPASQDRLRDIVNAIFYIAQTGCQWRMLPKDLPPFTSVQRYFYAWRDDGRWQAINHAMLMDAREAAGREASQPPASSTASRSRPPRRAVRAVSRREDGQRPQAAHPYRHDRTVGRCDRASGQYPGSGGAPACWKGSQSVSLVAPCLRR